MRLTNTRQRTYNGVKFWETVEVEGKEVIADYLENGFEKAGKEEVNGLASWNVTKEKALDKMNKTELLEEGTKVGLTLDPAMTNPDMVTAIEAKKTELASWNAQ